ncbi:hypothetical protein C2E23DRAFT_884265 [Lenzites betulinus]|nr:hypothetical protein C2E23DRAFT_884265 [Lenzites betulinus]
MTGDHRPLSTVHYQPLPESTFARQPQFWARQRPPPPPPGPLPHLLPAICPHLKLIAEKHQLRLTEIALRWCQHHSALTPQDGIIIGASSAAQLAQNLEDSEKGALPEEILKALDGARLIVGANAPTYWR